MSQATPNAHDAAELARDANYPISRWYLRPLARLLSQKLASTWARPWWFTLANLLLNALAMALLGWQPEWCMAAAVCVAAGWFADRMDGCLARRQGTASAYGAWLDGNIDELIDLTLHTVMAFVVAERTGNSGVWGLLVAFLIGKYLFLHSLQAPAGSEEIKSSPSHVRTKPAGVWCWLRAMYHAPANADVRCHLTIIALIGGQFNARWLLAELACLAVYYNLRWLARYGLTYRRLAGSVGSA